MRMRSDEAIAENNPEIADRLVEIKETVNAEMATRMQSAAEALRDVLTSPTPVIMEGKIVGLARQGRLDDAMLQLLQANLEQAQGAGEAGKNAVAALTKLQQRIQQELDEKLSPQASPAAVADAPFGTDAPAARLTLPPSNHPRPPLPLRTAPTRPASRRDATHHPPLPCCPARAAPRMHGL